MSATWSKRDNGEREVRFFYRPPQVISVTVKSSHGADAPAEVLDKIATALELNQSTNKPSEGI